jgi:hypothetical protein
MRRDDRGRVVDVPRPLLHRQRLLRDVKQELLLRGVERVASLLRVAVLLRRYNTQLGEVSVQLRAGVRALRSDLRAGAFRSRLRGGVLGRAAASCQRENADDSYAATCANCGMISSPYALSVASCPLVMR